MQARVKQAYRWKVARSCGVEFVKSEWRPVPRGYEAEAQQCSLLDVREPETITAGESASSAPPAEVESEPVPEIDATDAALKYAAKNGVDLLEIDGTGKDGRITLGDVKHG